MELSDRDKRVIGALEGGIPVCEAPYAALAEKAGLSETDLLSRLEEMLEGGVLKRIGLVVRHHELGYRHNAMVVWDVAEGRIRDVADKLSAEPPVTLCYRRPRRLPHWPYNLFCMIHGRAREEVLETVAAMVERHGLGDIPHDILFSKRRFKQRGARYCAPTKPEAA